MLHAWGHTEAFQMAVRVANFDGFHLSKTGIQCRFDLLKSIRDFYDQRILLIYAPGLAWWINLEIFSWK